MPPAIRPGPTVAPVVGTGVVVAWAPAAVVAGELDVVDEVADADAASSPVV